MGDTFPQSIPPEFNDRLATELLLQPDHEYIFAKHAYGALLAAGLGDMDGFDIAMMQLRDGRPLTISGTAANMAEAMANGQGGPLLLSMGMTFPDMVKMVREAKQPGEVIKINRPRYIDGSTDLASRQAGPATRFFGNAAQTIAMDQVSITVKEYLGPCDPNGNLAPISLPSFTADRAAHDLAANVGLQLKRDRWRFIDDVVRGMALSAAKSAGNVTRPDDISADSDYTGAGSEPFSYAMITKMAEKMRERKIPGIGGTRRYPLFLDTHQWTQLKRDPEFQRLASYHEQYNPLFPGYVRSIDEAILIEDARAPRLTNLGEGGNLIGYQAIMLAPGALGWGSAKDATPIRDRNDDGGRLNQYGWSAYEGFSCLDDRFIEVAITD